MTKNMIKIQCNLDLVTLNLVTTCDLAIILQQPFFNLLYKFIRFSDRPKVSLNRDCSLLENKNLWDFELRVDFNKKSKWSAVKEGFFPRLQYITPEIDDTHFHF